MKGSPELRQVVAQTYQTIGSEDILIHAGAEEAIFIFMNIALQPEDHIIVHFPCYQPNSSIAQSIGCEVDWWMSHGADNWELDLDWLRGQFNPIQRRSPFIVLIIQNVKDLWPSWSTDRLDCNSQSRNTSSDG